MKGGAWIYRKLRLTGRPAALVPELSNGELRNLLTYASRQPVPDEEILANAIVEAAQRFRTKGKGKVL